MTYDQMVSTTRVLVDNDSAATNDVLGVYLSLAKDRILNRLYPFDDSDEVPSQYHMLQCELASRAFLKRGAEGENTHNEDGVSRVYFSADEIDLLNRIVPFAKMG